MIPLVYFIRSVRRSFQHAEESPINLGGGDSVRIRPAEDGKEDGAVAGDRRTGYAAIQPDRSADNNYGYDDFRSISRWKYATRLLRGPETRAKINIGVRRSAIRRAAAKELVAKFGQLLCPRRDQS